MIAYAHLDSGLIGYALRTSSVPPRCLTIVVTRHQMLEETIIYCGVARPGPDRRLAPHVPGFENALSTDRAIEAIGDFARRVRDQLRSMPATGAPR